MEEKEIGQVVDFFTHVNVVAVKLFEELSVGDRIHIKGHTTDFIQEVTSIQIEHQAVIKAKAGDDVGIKVTERVRHGDKIFKVIAD
ncbi:MAG: translation elongation factor-like protein [Candidatus Omnitrophota bacterium]|nr:translation elongation factor-like protein [Candidatus Omnitrophota bacterium]